MPLACGGIQFWSSGHGHFPLLMEPSAVLSTLSPFSHLPMLETSWGVLATFGGSYKKKCINGSEWLAFTLGRDATPNLGWRSGVWTVEWGTRSAIKQTTPTEISVVVCEDRPWFIGCEYICLVRKEGARESWGWMHGAWGWNRQEGRPGGWLSGLEPEKVGACSLWQLGRGMAPQRIVRAKGGLLNRACKGVEGGEIEKVVSRKSGEWRRELWQRS